MSGRELSDAKKMFNYIVTVGKALENRFPDKNFIVENTAFINPALRKFQEPDLLALSTKFKTDYSPFQFNHDVLTCQMSTYQNDSTLDFQYQLAENDLIKILV